MLSIYRVKNLYDSDVLIVTPRSGTNIHINKSFRNGCNGEYCKHYFADVFYSFSWEFGDDYFMELYKSMNELEELIPNFKIHIPLDLDLMFFGVIAETNSHTSWISTFLNFIHDKISIMAANPVNKALIKSIDEETPSGTAKNKYIEELDTRINYLDAKITSLTNIMKELRT